MKDFYNWMETIDRVSGIEYEVLHNFDNVEDGTRAEVYMLNKDLIGVRLLDVEANEVVSVKRFPVAMMDKAIAFAKDAAGV